MTTTLRRHWRLCAAAVAAATVAGMGGHTLATWGDASDMPRVEAHTGALDVTRIADPIGTGAAVNWALITDDGAHRVDPATHYVMPGQHLRMTVSWQVTARGNNYLADLTFKNSSNGSPIALGGQMAQHIDHATATVGVLKGTVAPDGQWPTPLATAALGSNLPAVHLTSRDDGATFTTFLDITVKDDLQFDELEHQVLTVVNLDANLSQNRSGA